MDSFWFSVVPFLEIISDFANRSSGWVTALATVVLALLTLALVLATNRMARASSSAHVVANIEPNKWSIRHMDLVVQNCGSAPAYSVEIDFDPNIENTDHRKGSPLPLSKLSLVRPGQVFRSSLASYDDVKSQLFNVNLSWKLHPNGRKIARLSYTLNMDAYLGYGLLGGGDPLVEISKQLKNLRDDWKQVANGGRRTGVDVFDSHDRERAELEAREAFRAFSEKDAGVD